ncbi:sensor histidine kinase [Glycomyces tenuis]|uniref:sensor histidine kinase n=1 Tax=Glycomyces tenuis TaxID=58116 RepID=UPI003CCBCEC5
MVRHAGAGTARVALDWRTEGLTITVTDDGVGAGPGPVAGRGLVGIRERARACGGTAAFTAGPGGRGFAVEAHLPRSST